MLNAGSRHTRTTSWYTATLNLNFGVDAKHARVKSAYCVSCNNTFPLLWNNPDNHRCCSVFQEEVAHCPASGNEEGLVYLELSGVFLIQLSRLFVLIHTAGYANRFTQRAAGIGSDIRGNTPRFLRIAFRRVPGVGVLGIIYLWVIYV